MAKSVQTLYTTVENTSGKEAVFSFLPPHGKRMASHEELTIAGNLVDRLASKGSNRQFKALERAVMSKALTIVSTPSVFVYGETYTNPKVLGVTGASPGTLGMVDPSWGPTPITPSTG